jgi:hypothetical protein
MGPDGNSSGNWKEQKKEDKLSETVFVLGIETGKKYC